MSYATVGTVKSINLSNHTFKLDPISKYRFEVKDGDEDSLRIVFAEESNSAPDHLKLMPKDTDFVFKEGLESAMITLKQGKGKIRVVIEESRLANLINEVKDNGNNTGDDVKREKTDDDGETNKQIISGGLRRDIRIEVL